jgi:hypothetical protein
MNYTEVTSAFIIGLIRESSWQQHEKIDDLIHLQKFIVHPPKSFNSGWAFSHLKSTYPDEFLKLLEEYSPKALELELSEREQIRLNLEKLQTERQSELSEMQKQWLLAGGRL